MEQTVVNQVLWLNHPFHICAFSGSWRDVGGIYILSGICPVNGWWLAYYIGQTDSFRNRIPLHERWNEAVLRGATHVHAMEVPQAAQRALIERALIEAYQPPLNTQLRPPVSLADLFQPPHNPNW